MLNSSQNGKSLDLLKRARKELDNLHVQRLHASDIGNHPDAVYFAREISRHIEYMAGLESMRNVIREAQ